MSLSEMSSALGSLAALTVVIVASAYVYDQIMKASKRRKYGTPWVRTGSLKIKLRRRI